MKEEDKPPHADIWWKPKTDQSNAEKIAAFDKMQAFALSYVDAMIANERFKDAKHYGFETLMVNTVGGGVFAFLRCLGGS